MNAFKLQLIRIVLGFIACLGVFVIMLVSPVGRVFDRAVSSHLDGLNNKYIDTGNLSFAERVECILIYKLIALGGCVVSPEGSAIINHYIEGSGKDLIIGNSYIKTSPVINMHLARMRNGQTKRITLDQSADWRLSYALNPMNIRKGEHEVVIFQKIVFAKDRKTHTRLNYGCGKIKIPDGLIHALHPKPFMAYCKWRY